MPAERSSLLIASTDDAAAQALGAALFDSGFAGRRVTSGQAVFDAIEQGPCDVLIIDAELPGLPGAKAPRALAERGIEMPVVVLISAEATADGIAAVRA